MYYYYRVNGKHSVVFGIKLEYVLAGEKIFGAIRQYMSLTNIGILINGTQASLRAVARTPFFRYLTWEKRLYGKMPCSVDNVFHTHPLK